MLSRLSPATREWIRNGVLALLVLILLALVLPEPFWEAIRGKPEQPATELVHPGIFNVVTSGTTYKCNWEENTSVPDCEDLAPFQFGGPSFIYQTKEGKRLFLFTLLTGTLPQARLQAVDIGTKFEIPPQ